MPRSKAESRFTTPTPSVYTLRIECPKCGQKSAAVAVPYEHPAFHAVVTEYVARCPNHDELTQEQIDAISADLLAHPKKKPTIEDLAASEARTNNGWQAMADDRRKREEKAKPEKAAATPRAPKADKAVGQGSKTLTVLSSKNVFNSAYSKGVRGRPKVVPDELDETLAVAWLKGYEAGQKKAEKDAHSAA